MCARECEGMKLKHKEVRSRKQHATTQLTSRCGRNSDNPGGERANENASTKAGMCKDKQRGSKHYKHGLAKSRAGPTVIIPLRIVDLWKSILEGGILSMHCH